MDLSADMAKKTISQSLGVFHASFSGIDPKTGQLLGMAITSGNKNGPQVTVKNIQYNPTTFTTTISAGVTNFHKKVGTPSGDVMVSGDFQIKTDITVIFNTRYKQPSFSDELWKELLSDLDGAENLIVKGKKLIFVIAVGIAAGAATLVPIPVNMLNNTLPGVIKQPDAPFNKDNEI